MDSENYRRVENRNTTFFIWVIKKRIRLFSLSFRFLIRHIYWCPLLVVLYGLTERYGRIWLWSFRRNDITERVLFFFVIMWTSTFRVILVIIYGVHICRAHRKAGLKMRMPRIWYMCNDKKYNYIDDLHWCIWSRLDIFLDWRNVTDVPDQFLKIGIIIQHMPTQALHRRGSKERVISNISPSYLCESIFDYYV